MNTAEPKGHGAAALRVALRARILDAARRIVTRDGLHALSMRRLAEAIGYSPASLYLHFDSRDEIARALGREGFAQLLTHLEPSARIGDPWERLHALAHAYVTFGRTHQQAYRLMYMERDEGGGSGTHARGRATKPATIEPPAPAAQNDVMPCEEAARVADLFVDALEALATAGHLRHGAQGEPALLAHALWALLHGVVAFSLIGPEFAREASLNPIVDAALGAWLGAPVGEGAGERSGALPPACAADKTQEAPS
ncbi:TetR/AcrR family transcriptional regulator [Paraburkholderia tagetis]|uniref:TetR/AcrR family transcriptional regulator n=1 Tax=Paraburkholderia tagetis TaxID=2913261 RepID=A0A9X1UKF7_9BURK|nr:TetR/AcrR family transcriptional regulator [Paraburkholderia tagetis]MCG5073886.1 TetR/AcrR family transcriptional regulator [Paraburkholderia tagetis]